MSTKKKKKDASCRNKHAVVSNFVHDGVFYGCICKPNAEATFFLSNLEYNQQAILLHPLVFSSCSLLIGHPCLVNKKHVLISWPCEHVPMNSAMFSAHLSSIDIFHVDEEFITVEKYCSTGSYAGLVKIDLLCVPSFTFNMEDFLQVIKFKLVGDHIYHGMELCQSYFGQKVSFQVKSVETVKHDVPFDCVFWDHESSVDELAEIVESLDVSIGPIHQSVSYENCPLQTLSCFDCQPVILGHNPNANSIEGSPTNDSSFSSASVFSVQDSAAMIFLEVTELSRFEIYEETSCVRTQTDMFMLINFDSIGGLNKQIQELNHFCIHPLQNGTYGIPLQTGFLFHGPPGTGKSLFATALANELKAKPFYLSPADFIDSKSGLEKMRKAFRDVSELSHGIIIIDRLDVLCPHQSFLPTTDQKNTEHNLMSMMERLLSTANNMVIVIAIASNIGDVAPDLLKHGVFNKAIYFEVPSPLQRQQILQKMLLTVACDVSDEQVASIARDAHGFVGADLFQCFTKARFRLFCCKQSTGRLSYADLRQAMKEVTPSALVRETCEVDQVRWNDIAGMDSVKLQLRQMVEWPLKHPEIFQSLGALPPHQLLLYGPPGCSKTMLAKAVACESGLNFLSVKGPELLSKYVGESEKAARRLFDKARQSAPTVIFFDEVDSLCVDRSLSGNVTHGILATITQEMDTVATHGLDVFIIAATNRLDFLDPAFKARFRNTIYVPLPDDATREAILLKAFAKTCVSCDVSLPDLVTQTESFSGAELIQLCQEAGVCAIQDMGATARSISKRHFSTALHHMSLYGMRGK